MNRYETFEQLAQEIVKEKFFKFMWRKEIDNVICKSGWQEHRTPDSICNDMIDLYSFNINDKILILFNIELLKNISLRFDNLIYNNVYFVADSESKYDFIQQQFPQYQNIALLKDKNIESISKCIRENFINMNEKKFDVVFSNPPYTKNIDLDIIQQMFEFAVDIIVVHPSRFLIDKKHVNNSRYDAICNTYKLKKAVLFWGNDIFDIKLFYPMCISYWNTNTNNHIINIVDIERNVFDISIHDMTIHGKDYNMCKQMINKTSIYPSITKFVNNIYDKDKLYVNIPTLIGNIPKKIKSILISIH